MRTDGPDFVNRHDREPKRQGNPLWVWAFMWTVVGLAGAGFLFKLVEFTLAAVTTDGLGFALVPVVSYVAVALGFTCIFLWSFTRGEYRDVEEPKHRMLRMQEEFDRAESIGKGTPS